MKLRDYQEKAVQECLEGYYNGENVCVVSPTASGKSLIIKTIISMLLDKDSTLRLAVMAHRKELISQLGEFIDNPKVDCQTVQYLSRHPEIKYDLLIIDESHHVVSQSYRDVLANNTKQHMGFTATPLRGYLPEMPDDSPVQKDTWKYELTGLVNDQLYTKFVLTKSTRELIDEGYLCDYEIIHDYKFHIQHTGSKMLDYSKSEIDAAITPEECNAYVRATLEDKKAIIFCHAIDFANKLGKLLGDLAVVITSKTSKDKRNKLFNDFKHGSLQVLIGVDIFGEGVDVPSVDCCYLFRPTRSIPVYFQQIGRALRLSEGKEKAIIYDYVNNLDRLGVEPKDIKLSDMLLTGKFIKETCEYCGAYGIIEGKRDKQCSSIPSPEVQEISRWLSENEELWYYRATTNKNEYTIGLGNEELLSLDATVEYTRLLQGRKFKVYSMPIILNPYHRWEIATPRNASYAQERSKSMCLELQGKCKYSDVAHPYYLIPENLKKRDVKKVAKIKK